MAVKVWNLKYFAGNTGHLFADASNPQQRTEVLEAARQVEKNSWRAWVEHHQTGKRIFESEAERAHQQKEQADRIVRFAVDNVPSCGQGRN